MAAHKNNADSAETVDAADLQAAVCVLAGSDPENCSYSRGYVKRQAVFACNTCTPSAAEPAGICLACANECHDGHDIFELYTKRNFRCDCGNKKFGDFKCQLSPTKDAENVRNKYNHNFTGRYCTCDRPYPDQEDQVNDEMIQCVICEDWFHSKHLGCDLEEPEELQEMVCEGCMDRASFLWTYAAHLAGSPNLVAGGRDSEGGAQEGTRWGKSRSERTSHEVRNGQSSKNCINTRLEDAVNGNLSCKRKASPAEATTLPCRLKELQVRGPEPPRRGAVFWPYSWRSELCTCINCKKAYVAAEVPFLMDQSDTVLAYEQRGVDELLGQHPLMALTDSMDRVQQLEAIYGFRALATSVTGILDQCAAEGKAVTVEALCQFMDEVQASKRPRTD
uniref:Putative E3 ubiquitin-protein ligase UBR7 n=1 Tax=Tetraodon nigroviridis TaxID=99883 RepID=H3DJ07_TETNG